MSSARATRCAGPTCTSTTRLKRTSLAREGRNNNTRPGADFNEQSTALYERELLSTQLTGGFDFGPVLTVNTRGSYSTSKREAPYELGIGYVRSNVATSPYGDYFINRLDNGKTGYRRGRILGSG